MNLALPLSLLLLLVFVHALPLLLPLLLVVLLLKPLRSRCRCDARWHEPLAARAANEGQHILTRLPKLIMTQLLL